jgi:hypothetical protein
MKLRKCILVIALSAISLAFAFSNSMADYNTYDLVIERPDEGDLWQTGDAVRVKWTAYCVGQYPGDGIIHYMIKLDGWVLTYDYYDDWEDPGIPGCFLLKGSFRWIVPGNGYYKNPNAILTVMSGSPHCPDCYDLDGISSVSIRLKMWYDPIPIPVIAESSPLPGEDDIAGYNGPVYLGEPHPNPFNPQTSICFGLREAATVSMKVYSVDGRLVRTLHDCAYMEAGEYRESWNGLDNYGARVPAGVYLLKLDAGSGYSNTRKLVLTE